MTSYYSVSKDTNYGSLVLEIKTLNSRFFDLQIKLSDELRIHEPLIRKKIAKILSRGKIECKIFLKEREGLVEIKNDDLKNLKKFIKFVEKISTLIKEPKQINPVEIIRLHREKNNKQNHKGLDKVLFLLFDDALKKIITDRQREGKKIKQLISSRNLKIEKIQRNNIKVMKSWYNLINAREEHLLSLNKKERKKYGLKKRKKRTKICIYYM